MDNAQIAEHFSLLSKLIDIHGDDGFRSRSYGAAAFTIEKLPQHLASTPREKIAGIKGIGSSVAGKIGELLDTGKLTILHDYLVSTPPGVVEMLNIKGIGPKKIHIIWKEMGLESIGELLYACEENRLTRYKGFGEKTQQNVTESIRFYLQNQGHFLYAELEVLFPQIDQYLKKQFGEEKVSVTGRYRRQELTIEELEFVILDTNESIRKAFRTAQPPELLEEKEDRLLYQLKNNLKLRFYTGEGLLAKRLFETTGSETFLEAFHHSFPEALKGLTTEDEHEIFQKAGLPFIPPFLREDAAIIRKSATGLPRVIQTEDIRALIHCHSNWSDGSNTLEDMAAECIRRGWEYMVLSDHSQSAAYANGLKPDRILEQHRQVDTLNQSLAPFRIYKSIESDILGDGSLDYPEEILRRFDLVIASVHSNLGMQEDKANARLIKAIENPYTRILGHMTGRLLLSRNGYPLDHKKIIDACAANQVVIELNAHPRRLDIDWKWIPYALDKNVLLSINPDAHALDGYEDVKYGVLAAQKGGLTASRNLSSFTLSEFEKFLHSKRIS